MLGYVTLKRFVSHRLNDANLLQLKISSEEKKYSNNLLLKSIKVYNSIFPREIRTYCCFLLAFLEHFNIFFFYSHLYIENVFQNIAFYMRQF